MSFLRLLRGEREAQNAADGHSLPAKNKWRFKKMLTKACWTSDWRWIEWGRWRRGRNLPAQVLIQFSIVRRWDWRWRPSSPIFYCASFPRPSSSPFPDSIPFTLSSDESVTKKKWSSDCICLNSKSPHLLIYNCNCTFLS